MLTLLLLATIPALYLLNYALEPENSVQVNGSVLADGIEQTAGLRQAVVEFYWYNSYFPDRLDFKVEPQGAVRSIILEDAGRIIIEYNQLSGVDGGQILLTPEYTVSGVQWRCETYSFPGIERLAPQCRYCPPFSNQR